MQQRQNPYATAQPAPRDLSSLLDDIEIAPDTGRPIFQTMRQILNWARWMIASGLVSRAWKSPEAVAIAIQTGARLGFDEFQSVQNIAIVGQQPRLWGTGLMSIINRNMSPGGIVEEFSGRWTLDGQDIPADTVPSLLDEAGTRNVTYVVTARRRGQPAQEFAYGVQHAIMAGLWWGAAQRAAKLRFNAPQEADFAAAESPWRKNPADMLAWKARWRAAVALFSDLLMGMAPAEDASVLDAVEPTIAESTSFQRPRPTAAPPPPAPQAEQQPAREEAPTVDESGTEKISDDQLREFWRLSRAAGRTDDEVAAYLTDVWGLASSRDITVAMYEAVCAWAQRPPQEG